MGAAAGQSLSHLITALKAQSNNIIALSVTDDWDLQRAWSAAAPVHLTGQGCRLIKGLLNMVAQQLWLSQSTAYNHSTTDLCIATDRCHISTSWVVHSAYWSGRTIVMWSKMPLVSDVQRWRYKLFIFLHSAYPNTMITIEGWDRCILFIFICFLRVSRHILIFCSWLNGLPCVYIIKSDLLH